MPKKKSFKQMRMVANQLPVQFQEGFALIKGEEIIRRMNGTSKDAHGDPVSSDEWYRIPVQKQVNHYRRIKRLFNKKGYEGVSEYIDQVVQLHAETIVNHNKMLSNLPAQPMSI